MRLQEHCTETVPAQPPSRAVQDDLQRQLGDRLELLWLDGGRLRVTSRAWVGVVRLPDGTSIRIVPKLAGEELRVLEMLGLIQDLPPVELERLPRDLATAAQGDLLDLLCSLLCRSVAAILAESALRDYREDRDDLAFLRGRVQLQRQATTHHGRVDVLACRYQEFDYDVLENQILRAALARARYCARDPDVRRSASVLHDQLQELAPADCPTTAECRRRLTYDRRNQHYRGAHTWALALLEEQRIGQPFHDTGNPASVFLIDMNVLFEQFITWLIREVVGSLNVEVTAQHHDRSVLWAGAKPWGTIIPDLLIRSQGRTLAIDAKYKLYDLKRFAASDLYQLFLYAQAYGGFDTTPTAAMIYPSNDESADTQITLRRDQTAEGVALCIPINLPALLDAIAEGGHVRQIALEQVRSRLDRAFPMENRRTHHASPHDKR